MRSPIELFLVKGNGSDCRNTHLCFCFLRVLEASFILLTAQLQFVSPGCLLFRFVPSSHSFVALFLYGLIDGLGVTT